MAAIIEFIRRKTMKQKLGVIIVLALLIGVMFTSQTTSALAIGSFTPTPVPTITPTPDVVPPARVNGVSAGDWSSGLEVPVDLTQNPAPEWLQLMDDGVSITAPGIICHPFRGGRFGWVAEIRQLVDGNWVKVLTTMSRLTAEGEMIACAEAPAAGTYALFGYYTGPKSKHLVR